ncbi:potassium channel family protein [Heyndrickxia acidicola]|uniref:Potassium channel family protein n=1 Tax=Heyndrickxia acidicola TaxID=209389 RepID=A0ABU6MNI3_9BACI|nr:potassium channel family protein [Heyndrickxia acidicola]MED1205938.1 potassium channel family protein [Heyndrickxia acidicola]
MISNLYYLFLRWPVFIRMLILALAVICSFGFIIHLIEPHRFPTVFIGIYWSVITAATVGYGDLYPITNAGKLVSIFLVLTGVGVLSSYFVSLSAAAVSSQNAYMEGKEMFKGRNHCIIVGWNERASTVIEHLIKNDASKPIVLIDHSLDQNPYPKREVIFIKGKPHNDETLKRASLLSAECVLITADQNSDELHADMNSIMILLTVKGIHPQVFCAVEILKEENVSNARRAGADEVIQTNMQTSSIMFNSLVSHGISDSILSILTHSNGNHLQYTQATELWIGKTFKEVGLALQEERKLLIGLRRAEETIINPSPLSPFLPGDELLIISGDSIL